ncbi:MAG: hypothetical protein ACK4M3_04920 [Pyrobaculum sp.]
MKVSTGVAWGVITGFIIGVPTAILSYLFMVAATDWLKEQIYRHAVAMGRDPEAARQIAELAVASAIATAPIGAFLFTIALYLVIGIIMALLWKHVRPWYVLGLLFGVILFAIDVVPDLLSPMPTEVSSLAYMSPLLNFVGPFLLAWFLNRRALRPEA